MLVYEFKLSGTQQQYRLIDEAIRTALFVRNSCVRYWMDNAKIGKYDLSALCKALSKEFLFANKLNSMARQASAERAWSSISRFHENCKKKIKGKKGYPKFKRRGNSVEYKTSGWAFSEDRKHLALTDGHNIGIMKLVGTYDLHYYQVEQIKRVRLVRRADGYYAQFLIKAERNIDTTPTGKTIGLDVGLNHFYTDSNGGQIETPRFLRKSEKSIKKLQKRVSRKFSKTRKRLTPVGSPDHGSETRQQEKIKQSNNYLKAKNKLSRKHLKVSRQRKDHAVKLARCVVASNDVVVYEDLRVANMVKNHKLAKSISDASWYQFRVWIEYFGRIFGRTTIAVAPQYTSQDCSNCGKRVQKTLSTRTHKCPHCGYTADRDENAAINILKKGIATTGHVGSSELDSVNAWGDLSSTGNDVNQSQQDRSLNQESPDFLVKTSDSKA
ncbi:transposase [Chamaesiphon sp. VAR_48_metabat_403]|uniref:RNA-guided endonuclease InsQ/TnpB family protein n=1 Tax=Chamaesiphon sp. VAR_48_metabat_403 TaxID=2964700 RepID=UPI00286EA485|nr:transposase [Chamaesiphon sp. VAR_48_metabat_403]